MQHNKTWQHFLKVINPKPPQVVEVQAVEVVRLVEMVEVLVEMAELCDLQFIIGIWQERLRELAGLVLREQTQVLHMVDEVVVEAVEMVALYLEYMLLWPQTLHLHWLLVQAVHYELEELLDEIDPLELQGTQERKYQ